MRRVARSRRLHPTDRAQRYSCADASLIATILRRSATPHAFARQPIDKRSLPCTTVCITMSHTPAAVFLARLLENQEGANAERCVFGKLSTRCFQRRPCWHRHHSNHGTYQPWTIAPGGGGGYTQSSYTVLRCMAGVARTRSQYPHSVAKFSPFAEIKKYLIVENPSNIYRDIYAGNPLVIPGRGL